MGKRYFRHFKGGKYVFVTEALDSETLEELVVYKALYGEGKFWVRPKAMFFENVVQDGVEMPRFREISEAEAMAD